jgi:hypothetical protein
MAVSWMTVYAEDECALQTGMQCHLMETDAVVSLSFAYDARISLLAAEATSHGKQRMHYTQWPSHQNMLLQGSHGYQNLSLEPTKSCSILHACAMNFMHVASAQTCQQHSFVQQCMTWCPMSYCHAHHRSSAASCTPQVCRVISYTLIAIALQSPLLTVCVHLLCLL